MSTGNASGVSILAIHASAKVRGAIHRSLSQLEEFDISVAPNVEEGRTQCFRHRPSAVVLPYSSSAVDWAVDLHSRQLVSVVFCFVRGADMSRCKEAREIGIDHFVELPSDSSAAWARAAQRIAKTLGKSIRSNRARRQVFAKSTIVQPAVMRDLLESRSPTWTLEVEHEFEEIDPGKTTRAVEIITMDVERCKHPSPPKPRSSKRSKRNTASTVKVKLKGKSKARRKKKSKKTSE